MTDAQLRGLKAGQTLLDFYGDEWKVVGEWPILGVVWGWRYMTLDERAPFKLPPVKVPTER